MMSDNGQVCKQGTLLFSKEAALLSQVIPAMDIIEDVFTTMTIEKPNPNDAKRTITKTLSPALKASMALGHATLNKYYCLTDDSEVYRIAMGTFLLFYRPFLTYVAVLHPEYKLKYFKDQHWDQSWIDNAREVVRQRYNDRYAGCTDLLSDADRQAEEAKDKAVSHL